MEAGTERISLDRWLKAFWDARARVEEAAQLQSTAVQLRVRARALRRKAQAIRENRPGG